MTYKEIECPVDQLSICINAVRDEGAFKNLRVEPTFCNAPKEIMRYRVIGKLGVLLFQFWEEELEASDRKVMRGILKGLREHVSDCWECSQKYDEILEEKVRGNGDDLEKSKIRADKKLLRLYQ